jgi:hypothetical protein
LVFVDFDFWQRKKEVQQELQKQACPILVELFFTSRTKNHPSFKDTKVSRGLDRATSNHHLNFK